MKLKFGIHYIATSNSIDGEIKAGDTISIQRKRADSELGHAMFLPVRESQEKFFGMKPLNYVRYFDTIDEIDKSLEGVEVKLNLYFAECMINDLQRKIDKYKKDYYNA